MEIAPVYNEATEMVVTPRPEPSVTVIGFGLAEAQIAGMSFVVEQPRHMPLAATAAINTRANERRIPRPTLPVRFSFIRLTPSRRERSASHAFAFPAASTVSAFLLLNLQLSRQCTGSDMLTHGGDSSPLVFLLLQEPPGI